MAREFTENQEDSRLRYFIIFGILLIFFLILYVYYIIIKNVWDGQQWENDFFFYNVILFIIFGLIAIISLYYLIRSRYKWSRGEVIKIIIEKLRNNNLWKILAFIIGCILILIAAIIWIPIHDADTAGVIAGFLGTIGLFLLVLSRRDVIVKRTLGILILLLGALLVVSAPIHEAFVVRDVGLWNGWNILLVLIGVIVALCGVIIIEKDYCFSKIGYFALFVFGAFSILLIPFHEYIDLNATKSYGEYDITLGVFAIVIMFFGAVLYILKRWKHNRFYKYCECGDKNYNFGIFEKDRKRARMYFIRSAYCYWRAIEMCSIYAILWNNLGNALRKLREYDRAFDCYEVAIEIDKYYDMPHHGMGIIYLIRKQCKKALRSFEKAIKLNPNNKQARNSKGIALAYCFGRYCEAVSCFDRAIEIDPDYYAAIRNKELCLATVRLSMQKELPEETIETEYVKVAKTVKESYEKKIWHISVNGILLHEFKDFDRIFKDIILLRDEECLISIKTLDIPDYNSYEINKGLQVTIDTIKTPINENEPFENISINAFKVLDKEKYLKDIDFRKGIFLMDKDRNLDMVYYEGKDKRQYWKKTRQRLISFKNTLEEFSREYSDEIIDDNIKKWELKWKV